MTYQGPIPPPEILERFDILVPGTAKLMIEQSAEESRHRHALEEKTTLANIETQSRAMGVEEKRTSAIATSDLVGQVFGFVVAISCIVGAVYLAVHGYEKIAVALTILPSAAVLNAFFAKRVPAAKSK